VTIGGAVTDGSASVESADEKPSGISNSEDEDSLAGEGVAFPLFRLRCL
jgi:hypothetical protein